VVAAGGLLAGVLGLTATATPGTASPTDSTTDWTSGRGAGAPTWSGEAPSSTTDPTDPTGSTGSVDSTDATAAESRGVALVDTVLSGGEAAGTGVVLTSDGEVLTNYHVVEDSTSIRVTIASTGKAYTATVVGSDPTADIALLQLKGATGLTASRIDDDTVRLGDDVTAVGNAGGTGTLSAADGDVTDLSTSITTAAEDGVAGETLTRLIETDADVVAGDSGGPLVDAEGEVVGIDTAASSGGQIDGYAIPIDTALAVVTQIRSGHETGTVRIGASGFLGVEVGSAADDSGYGYGYGSGDASGATTSGAAVVGVVEDGAAADAGLVAGDTITRLGSSTVTDADDLTTALSALDPGDRVKITWTNADGHRESGTVTLGTSPVN
jgi:S1-C subfamily serine protease